MEITQMFATVAKNSAIAFLAAGLVFPAFADATSEAAEAIANADLKTFDTLDFDDFNAQAWDH
jgi:hypothetical protein